MWHSAYIYQEEQCSMQILKIQLYTEKSSGDTTAFDQTHKRNRPQKGTNDVRKTDKGIFQRTGKKPQRKIWQKISHRLHLQLSEKLNAALQQSTVCSKQESSSNMHGGHIGKTQVGTFMTYFVHFILMISF